jgi:hypothetical protein
MLALCDDERGYADLGLSVDVIVLQRRLRALMTSDSSAGWSRRLLAAIPVGIDSSGVFARFVRWLLVDPDYGVRRCLDSQSQAAIAIRKVADLYVVGAPHRRWAAAGSAAESAAAMAMSNMDAHAAWSAAWAVEHVIRLGDGVGVDELLDSAFCAIGVAPGSAWVAGASAELLRILASPTSLADDADIGAPGDAG